MNYRNANGFHVNNNDRAVINSDLRTMIYGEDLGKAIEYINNILKRQGLMLLDEDNTPFEAIFCGTEGNITINIGTWTHQPIANSVIVFQWYRLETKYEINTYMS